MQEMVASRASSCALTRTSHKNKRTLLIARLAHAAIHCNLGHKPALQLLLVLRKLSPLLPNALVPCICAQTGTRERGGRTGRAGQEVCVFAWIVGSLR